MAGSSKDDTLFLRRMQDLAERADRIGFLVFSEFLDGGQRSLAARLTWPAQIQVQYLGGYEDAERVTAVFYPSFLDYEAIEGAPDPNYDSPIDALYVRLKGAKFARKIPGHRDYLGSLMGLGIKRETLGDILPDDEGAVLIVSHSISDFIRQNLLSVGSLDVSIEDIAFSEIRHHVKDGKEMVIGLQSVRLDAVISKTFALGRQDAVKTIQSGRVQVNWKDTDRTDYSVKEGDLISVRGFGRIRIGEQTGISRSGRSQIRVIRYGS